MSNPPVKNKRFYLFNETSYVLNALDINETPNNISNQYSIDYYKAIWEYDGVSPHFDGTSDNIDIFLGLPRKNYNNTSINLNMLKTNDSNTYVDLSTINITTSNNSVGTAIFEYGVYTYNLTNVSQFTNEYSSPLINGEITLNPNSSFYGKIILTYNTIDLCENVSDQETLTLYILPYSFLRMTKINNINSETLNNQIFNNNLSDPEYTFTLSEISPKYINLKLSNSNSDSDSNMCFNTTITGSTFITNYVNSLIRCTVNMVDILWAKLDDVNVTNDFFTTDYSSVLKIQWGSYIILNLIFDNTTSIGTYETLLKITTNTTNINGNSRFIYGDLSFIIKETEIVGDINYKSGNNDSNFIQTDAFGIVTTHYYNGVPLHKMLIVTAKPQGSQQINVDLTDTTYFKYSTLVVISNDTLEDMYVNIQNSGTGIENNTIYISSDNTALIHPNKRMIFLRVLFDPVIWEPSDEFTII